jgi:hypothetical protein
MLENTEHRTSIQNRSDNSVRKTWIEFFGTFFSYIRNFPGRLQGLGEATISGRVDEKVPENFSPLDKIELMEETKPKTREEIFKSHQYEWVKTDRAGDVCFFDKFEIENSIEYVCFTDFSRIRSEFVGDIVLMHSYDNEILGRELLDPTLQVSQPHVPTIEPVANTLLTIFRDEPISESTTTTEYADPVIALLEKTKKRSEKITLTLNVKIPSPDLYAVIRDNFDNTDEILLESIMKQVQEKILRDAVKRELQNIYSTKKKKQ